MSDFRTDQKECNQCNGAWNRGEVNDHLAGKRKPGVCRQLFQADVHTGGQDVIK